MSADLVITGSVPGAIRRSGGKNKRGSKRDVVPEEPRQAVDIGFFEPALLAQVPVESLICYHLCYQVRGWPRVRSAAESEGPRDHVREEGRSIHQRAHGPIEEGRLQVPSPVRHRLSEGPRGRRSPEGEGDSAGEGVHRKRASRTHTLRGRGSGVPPGGHGRARPGAARHRGPPQALPPADLLPRAEGGRVRTHAGGGLGDEGGEGGGAPGLPKDRGSAADERARLLCRGSEKRIPGRHHRGSVDGKVRSGGRRPWNPPAATRRPFRVMGC